MTFALDSNTYLYKSKLWYNFATAKITGFIMNAGEMLEKVDGLTHDKLTYFVRAGYLKPKKIKRGSLHYNEFSDKDLQLVKVAWDYIKAYGTKTSIAFEKAKAETDDPQMKLL